VSVSTATVGAGSNTAPSITTTGDTNTGIFFPAADTIAFSEGGVEAARIDASGNMGIGVTPSAFGSGSYKALQIGGSLSFMGRSGGSDAYMMSNTFFDQTNYKYVASLAAARYTQSSGEHQWYNAASGTAGNTISFTQAMTLDASGNLGIGTSSPGAKLDVVGSGNYDGVIRVRSTGTNTPSVNLGVDAVASADGFVGTVSNIPFHLRTNDLNRATITSGGDLLVGLTSATVVGAPTRIGVNFTGTVNYGLSIVNTNTSTGTAINFVNNSNGQVGAVQCSTTTTTYGTSSDYRLKENIAPMTGALSTIAQLKPCTYAWKSTGESTQGFIAHELQSVVPECVTGEKDAVDADGNPKYQGIDTSFLVATLTAAIQEQQALITTLTDRITALEQA
jgi:hypothetical protein